MEQIESPNKLILKYFNLYAALILLLGIAARLKIFTYELTDGDELIYQALVEQLSKGAGYTLKGHPILTGHWIAADVYDSAYFLHPPIGIFYFWLFSSAVTGLKLAQLFCFILFFSSSILTLRFFVKRDNWLVHLCFPILVAFTPLFAHTNTKVWIDNPRLAFLSLHMLLVFLMTERKNLGLYLLAGFTSLLTVLTKLDGLIALPFVYLLALGISQRKKELLPWFIAFLLLNSLAAFGWLWISKAFEYGGGKPSLNLIKSSLLMQAVNWEMTPLRYIADYLKLMATVAPGILIIALRFREKIHGHWQELYPRFVLIAWILFHMFFYFLLACLGYSKLLRYLIMTTPACCFLFVFTLQDLQYLLKQKIKNSLSQNLSVYLLTALLGLGFFEEILMGIHKILVAFFSAIVLPLF